MGKNDDAWENAFKDLNILDHIQNEGKFEVDAKQLIHYREPRLMCKIDSKGQQPKIFQKYKLSILPKTRGSYVIGKFDIFENLSIDELTPTKTVYIPSHIRTFDDLEITSESNAINIAYISGIFDDLFRSNDINYIPTLSGRMGSGEFSFFINGQKINVKNSQMEIDASFENINSILLIEAKNKIPTDFNIRQLYYPFRYYNTLISNKCVYPVFMTYSNSIFQFHIYEFSDITNMLSIRKIGQKNYILNKSVYISKNELLDLFHSTVPDKIIYSIPFPQADSMSRIIDILNHFDKEKNNYELSNEIGLAYRQGQYYMRALEFLGLVEKGTSRKSRLTSFGKLVKEEKNINIKNRMLIKAILKHKIFREAFWNILVHENINEQYFIRKLINLYNINEQTAKRRLSTIKSWINWIIAFTKKV